MKKSNQNTEKLQCSGVGHTWEYTGNVKEINVCYHHPSLDSSNGTWRTTKVYEIRALKDIVSPKYPELHFVKAGEVGGWIEHEYNLAENAWIEPGCVIVGEGKALSNSWLAGRVMVMDNAEISGNAFIMGSSIYENEAAGCFIGHSAKVTENAYIDGDLVMIFGHCTITNHAMIKGMVSVFDTAFVGGSARIEDWATIAGNAKVIDSAFIRGFSRIQDNALVCENSVVFSEDEDSHPCVYGEAIVKGFAAILAKARISGSAVVSGHAVIASNAKVHGRAVIQDNAIILDDVVLYGDIQAKENAVVMNKFETDEPDIIAGNARITYESFKSEYSGPDKPTLAQAV